MIGAVLAGGRGRRFGGDKLLFRIGGKPLISYALQGLEMSRYIDEVVIIAAPENAQRLRELGYRVVIDRLLVGPIGGIYIALSLGDAFVAAGDMPSIIPEFVDYIIKQFWNSGKIVCVPRWANGYLEPLHAAYSQDFREILGEQIRSGDYMIRRAIEKVDACYIPIEELPEEWKASFFNVNRKEDLRRFSPL
ncbi:molybdenum cofactor guanylyltransferase MobA [Pyrococcus yayanosii]|uniref:Probable molybdenum cofactor guanylyltransferase n=1 Tax=Pyrococcus yayanosii (strain CH1 / JCM 16557) TaxID=529709 RepID=F8AI97_PYRYC|nr:molybdenum cofactor guanylyltransferase MobA [Pyrococcus yayanosii]AEH24334.1 Molybdopterin-guanine dinucleotide biosynthesis protein A (mobA) [Pyrococcus yayanosii CH1]